MTRTDKHIIKTYSGLFEGLAETSKEELIKLLSKSLKKENSSKEKCFYDSFGAFSSEESPEEIIGKIKKSRVFRAREIDF
ncbi:MAG: hypothetical protein RIF33_03725 [Cyclobacteriaceae bacterium]